MMFISLIVARGTNGVIGVGNQLPWYLPSDLKYFKATTFGKPIIMGRKTFESIGRPLPGRTNIVVTRNENFKAEGVLLAFSLDQACHKGKARAALDGKDEIMIIGGATIYQEAMGSGIIDRLYITQVITSPKGDAFFEAPDESIFRLGSEKKGPESKELPAFSYQIWDRI